MKKKKKISIKAAYVDLVPAQNIEALLISYATRVFYIIFCGCESRLTESFSVAIGWPDPHPIVRAPYSLYLNHRFTLLH